MDVPKFTRFALMSTREVTLIINSMKAKLCELDCIPTHILKMLLPKTAPLITKIINASLNVGEFCAKWKTAIVCPLLKKLGLALIFPNYRPVSNLIFISKVVERCMLLQLSRQCEEFNLQPDYQSAYRENYSCKTAVLSISDNILWAMEHQRITSLIAIDLLAAFDTVDHDVLLNILRCKFGIEDKAL